MPYNSFMDKLRIFLGFNNEPPRNDFRNPIWGSDDDDDGDELYSRDQLRTFTDPGELHSEMTKHIHDMFKSFGNMFGDAKVFLNEDNVVPFTENSEPEGLNGENLRNFYLKPGYHRKNDNNDDTRKDTDLDGKISSHEISGLLKRNDESQTSVPYADITIDPKGNSKCSFKTVITTSVLRADGSVETKRIVKDKNGVVEETVTQTAPTNPTNTNHEIVPAMDIYNHFASEFNSFWKVFN